MKGWIKAKLAALSSWYTRLDKRFKAWDERTAKKWDDWSDL